MKNMSNLNMFYLYLFGGSHTCWCSGNILGGTKVPYRVLGMELGEMCARQVLYQLYNLSDPYLCMFFSVVQYLSSS